MSAKETQNAEVQTTTHYWGYREIDPSEFKYVGGGDDGDGGGDYGDSGGCDSGAGASDSGASASDSGAGVGSGDDGDDSGAGTNVADTGGAGTGGKGCTAADTAASCGARQDGYAMCDALGYGVQAAASLSGSKAAQDLAAQVGPTCRAAVDNVVDAAYRTEMYEQQNQSYFPSYYGYDGGN
jgi:hypothetical protein